VSYTFTLISYTNFTKISFIKHGRTKGFHSLTGCSTQIQQRLLGGDQWQSKYCLVTLNTVTLDHHQQQYTKKIHSDVLIFVGFGCDKVLAGTPGRGRGDSRSGWEGGDEAV